MEAGQHLYANSAKRTKCGMLSLTVKPPARSNQSGCTKWCSVTTGLRLFLRSNVKQALRDRSQICKCPHAPACCVLALEQTTQNTA